MSIAKLFVVTVVLLFFASVPVAFALPSDRHATIRIESDRAYINEKTGITIYEGSVVTRQGSIQINADKVTIYSIEGQANKIVCVGQPASYRQRPESGGSLVSARASTIEYYLETDVISLVDNASLVQDGLILNGNKINYDLKAERVEATGDAANNQRVHMVIPPSEQLNLQGGQ